MKIKPYLLVIALLLNACTSLQDELHDEFFYNHDGPPDLRKANDLLAKGANINKPQDKGSKYGRDTALAAAIGNCDFRGFKYLMEKGADPWKINFRDGAWVKEHALHAAAQKKGSGCEHIIIYLVNISGHSVDVRDSSGRTPLMIATYHSERYISLKIIKLLLELGADPNARSSNFGRTVLHSLTNIYSGRTPNISVINLLIEHGADPALKDANGNTFQQQLKNSQLRHANFQAKKRISAQKKAARKKFWKDFSKSLGNAMGSVAQSMEDSTSNSASFEQNIQNTYQKTMNDINSKQHSYQSASSPTTTPQPLRYGAAPHNRPSKKHSTSQNNPAENTYDAEKQNCLNAGKTWKSNGGCNYANDVTIQGWQSDTINQSNDNQTAQDTSLSSTETNTPHNTAFSDHTHAPNANPNPTESKNTHPPIAAEAYCWRTKLERYICDGPGQKLLTSYATLAKAQDMVDCRDATHLGDGWYDCNRELKSSERDVRTLRQK